MHPHIFSSWPFFLSGLFGFLLAGCATQVGNDFRVSEGELALHDSIPKAESIAKLETHISAAKYEDMPFLAPHHFREASDILKDIQRTSPRNVTTYDLAKADMLIDRGEAVIEKVKTQLGKELELKALLDRNSAEAIYPRRYKSGIRELSRLIEKIELGRAGSMERDRADLNKSLQELYNDTVAYAALHGSPLSEKGASEK